MISCCLRNTHTKTLVTDGKRRWQSQYHYMRLYTQKWDAPSTAHLVYEPGCHSGLSSQRRTARGEA
eukprot:6474912-Amphidinium_carterae.1